MGCKYPVEYIPYRNDYKGFACAIMEAEKSQMSWRPRRTGGSSLTPQASPPGELMV